MRRSVAVVPSPSLRRPVVCQVRMVIARSSSSYLSFSATHLIRQAPCACRFLSKNITSNPVLYTGRVITIGARVRKQSKELNLMHA